jgi:hypothetical protein
MKTSRYTEAQIIAGFEQKSFPPPPVLDAPLNEVDVISLSVAQFMYIPIWQKID